MTTTVNARRSESSHWYHIDGTPCYELKKKSGPGMKRPTLADARDLNLLPGVTGILKILHKPALQDWLISQAVKAVMDTPRLPGEDNNAFVERVLVQERVQDKEASGAADLGTEVHEAIEDAIQGDTIEPKYLPYVNPVMAHLKEMGKVVKSEFIVVGKGYAGRADVLLDNGHTLTLPDFKTCRTMPKKESWAEHRCQTAFYAAALGNVADRHIVTGNIYISTTNPGETAVFLQEDWATTYENACKPLLALWCYLNSYRPLDIQGTV